VLLPPIPSYVPSPTITIQPTLNRSVTMP
jgi:hypothetical protein